MRRRVSKKLRVTFCGVPIARKADLGVYIGVPPFVENTIELSDSRIAAKESLCLHSPLATLALTKAYMGGRSFG